MSSEKVRKAIMAMMTGMIPLNATWCTVKSVSGQACTVLIDELEVEGMLLGFDKSGVIVYPKVNSDVLVAFVDNSRTNGAVICVEQTDRVEMMGVNYGGIAMTKEIADRIKRLEDALKNFETVFNTHLALFNAHVHSGGTIMGSTGIPAAPDTNTSNQNLTPRTDQNYISSPTIKHGNG